MKPRSKVAGGALITAIFLIVVLLALGAAMTQLSNVEHDTTSKANLSAKAYYGAKAGLEWGIQQAIGAGSCAGTGGSPLAPAGSLAGVSIDVTCVQSTLGAGNLVYYVTSRARIGTVGESNYAERWMEATVSNIP
jgi:MSHA biogenesis protein MshP